MKELTGLRWRPRYVSHMGCLKGCLDYLGMDVSWPWLYGGTGHAFVINMHQELCPSGPTAWNTSMLFQLGQNLGYAVDGVLAWKADHDFAAKQQVAWDFVRAAIDDGLPCYGWEAMIPEYYVLYGYDEAGYHYSGVGADDGGGPVPWGKLGTIDVGLLEAYRVRPGRVAPDAKVVKDAITLALKHAANPQEWIHPGYTSGAAAFDVWAAALEAGKASRDGDVFNNQCWLECREMAIQFLAEAQARLPGRCDAAFDGAIRQYRVVRDRLAELLALIPERASMDFSEPVASQEGAALVRGAAAAEREALACLADIAGAVG